jgi:pimeloyl-ACP methyl ester carboxylesterase
MPTDPTVVRDVVVVLPGIMGSSLRRGDRDVWSLSPGSLARALVTLGRDVRALALPAGIGDAEPDDPPDRAVVPTGLIGGLHVIPGVWSPIDGYGTLLGQLRDERFHLVEADPHDPDRLTNLVPYPYDWRLSCRANARRLCRDIVPVLERWRSQPGFGDARLVIIAHSMGGLVARHFLEREGGAELTRALVTVGTPHRGALNALDTLVNGLRKGVGPLAVDLTDFARSLPSMYELLPQYDAIVRGDGTRTAVDASVPGLDPTMLAASRAFHGDIATAVAARPARGYELHKVVGIRQPTATTARVVGDRVEPHERIDGRDQGGDGTVPRLASEPLDGRLTEVHPLSTRHGSLQAAKATFDLIDELLTREEIVWQGGADEERGLSVAMDELWLPTEAPTLTVRDMPDLRLRVSVTDEQGREAARPAVVPADGSLTLRQLPPGGYRATVVAPAGGPPPLTVPFVVWDPVAS